MSQEETERMLRKALNAVDRRKQRMIAAVIVVGLVVAALQMWLARLNDTGDFVAIVSLGMLEFWMAVWALVIVLQITIATKRILRAIDLASKPRP
jgi:hypothetical protein